MLAALGQRSGHAGATATTLGFAASPQAALRRFAFLAFSGVALVMAGRMVWSISHPRPALALTADLHVEGARRGLDSSADFRRPERYGLLPGDRIVTINGQTVGDRSEMNAAIDAAESALLEIEVFREGSGGDGAGIKLIYWIERPLRVVPTISERGLSVPFDDALGGLAGEVVAKVNDASPTDQASLEAAVRAAPPPELRLTLSPQAGVERELVSVQLSWRSQWVIFVSGLGFAALGFITLYWQPDTRSSWGFLLFCAHIAAFSLFRAIPHLYRLPVERHLFLLLQCFLPLSTLLFLTTFSPLRLLVRRSVTPLAVGATFGLALLLGNWLLSPAEAEVGVLSEPLFLAWIASILGILVLAQPADLLVRWTGRRLGPVDRQRGTVLRWATVAGFLPSLSFGALLVIFPLSDFRVWFELSVLLFPLIVAYAIVRHDFLALGELAREALLFAGLMALLIFGYSLLAATLVPLVERLSPGAATWSQPLSAGALVLLIAPLHTRLRQRLQARFRRLPLDWESLQELIESAAAKDRDPSEFSREVVELVARTCRADVSLLIGGPGDGWWLAARTRSDAAGPDSARVRRLAGLMRQENSPMIRDRILDDLRYRELRTDLLSIMDHLLASVVVPMEIDGRLGGLLVLGEKANRRPWSAAELHALRRLARTSAHHLDVLIREASVRSTRSLIDLLPALPRTIGRWKIQRLVGQGGMSYVYLGVGEGGSAAIKVANHQAQRDTKSMQRFVRESQALSRIDHPNIVRILDVGQQGRDRFIAMEYLADGSLDDLIAARKLGEAEVLSLLIDICSGLAAALEVGVQHRDIKPRNIFLSSPQGAKVGDFGLARLSDETTITTEGKIFGTPAYLSPEMLTSQPVTWRADQYALGITAWELFARQRPFQASNLAEAAYQHTHEPLPPLAAKRPGLRPEVVAVVERMSAKDPDDRFPSYDHLLTALLALRQSLIR